MSVAEIAAAYDAVAERFAAARSSSAGVEYLERFAGLVTPGGAVLDVGCGTGLPLTRRLLEHGFTVHALDASPGMLGIARRNAPGARFHEGDVVRWNPPRRFDGILAWDSTFHLPPGDQLRLLEKFEGALEPGGVCLLTCGVDAGEIHGPMFGLEFYYGSPSLVALRHALEPLGCEPLFDEVDDPHDGGHAVLCFRKKGRSAGPRTIKEVS